MKIPHKINGKTVKPEDWEVLRELTLPLNPRNKALLAKSELSTTEVYQLLDANRDRKFEPEDLRAIPFDEIDSLDTVLTQYGIAWATHLINNPSYRATQAPLSLWQNKTFVMAAVEKEGLALNYASEDLKNDRDVVMKAITQNPKAIQYSPRYQDLPERALTIDPAEAGWQMFLTLYKGPIQSHLQPSEYRDHSSMIAALKQRYNIEYPERFLSADILFNIIDQRALASDSNNSQPSAVLVYPKTDRNTAFTQYPVAERLMALGYRVYYHEAGTDEEITTILETATAAGKKKASVVVLAGHGTPDSLQLGARDIGEERTAHLKKFLDVTDFQSGCKIDFRKYLAPDGDLLLYSCSNGSGGEKNPNNLANTMARHNPGVIIHASTLPANIASLDADIENGRPRLRVKWTEDSYYSPNARSQHGPSAKIDLPRE